MGIISQSGNADILNIKQNYIAPLEYQVRLDIELSDRDYVLGKIKTLINDVKGSKFDILTGVSGTQYVLSNPNGFNASDKPILQNGCFVKYSADYNWQTSPTDFVDDLKLAYGLPTSNFFVYLDGSDGDTLSGLYKITFTYTAPSTYSFTYIKLENTYERNKVSVSFNGIQSQEPYINNGLDRVFLFFGGNATIVDGDVTLGNDIVQTTIQLGKDTGTIYNVEPTELTGSLDVNDDTYPLWSTGYQNIDRNMAISNKVSYSFVFDKTIPLFLDLYKYGRYGSGSGTYAQQVFTVKEYRYDFGGVVVDKFYAKLGSVNTQNTNGDVMTISVLFKVGAY
jgi:hypothetical protein